jgi:hypothetical protein
MWDYGQDVVHEEFEERDFDLLPLADLLRHAWMGRREVIPIAEEQQGNTDSDVSFHAPCQVVSQGSVPSLTRTGAGIVS